MELLKDAGTLGAVGLWLYYMLGISREKDKIIKEDKDRIEQLSKENDQLQERIIQIMEERALQTSNTITTLKQMYEELKTYKNKTDT